MNHSDQALLERELEAIYLFYAALSGSLEPETGLGGQFLFAGEITATATHLLRAANIAGGASLAASADAPALRRAMREGALDFVVTSLGEALRILKNQIRKKQPVAVGVALAQEAIASEMLARGVQPDLLPSEIASAPDLNVFLARGARAIEPKPLPPGMSLHIFAIPPRWQQPSAAFDALLLDCLPPADHVNRRWVELAPRYLPAAARRLRSVACGAGAAELLIARLGSAISANPAQ